MGVKLDILIDIWWNSFNCPSFILDASNFCYFFFQVENLMYILPLANYILIFLYKGILSLDILLLIASFYVILWGSGRKEMGDCYIILFHI